MFRKLAKILEYKDNVMVKDDNEFCCVFSSVRDDDDNFRRSSWSSVKESVKSSIGSFEGYFEKQINEKAKEDNWQIVEIWDNSKKRFEVGDKVKIAENAEEMCESVKFGVITAKIMAGNIYEIKEVVGSNYEIRGWFFPHSALEPVFEEEITVAEVEKIVAEKLGYDVKIK